MGEGGGEGKEEYGEEEERKIEQVGGEEDRAGWSRGSSSPTMFCDPGNAPYNALTLSQRPHPQQKICKIVYNIKNH